MACPNCLRALDSQNRLIIEDCGHSKCRSCLIAEADGCKKCNESRKNLWELKFRDDIKKSQVKLPESKKIRKKYKVPIPPHIIQTKQPEDSEILYHCKICNKSFKSRTQQYYHLFCKNSHDTPFKCDECEKSFSKPTQLKYHKTGHSQQSFPCPLCEKEFSKLQILRKHQRIHERTKEQCSECGAYLRNKEALDAHMKRHQNILPFVCDQCDKRFSLQTSLRTHQQVVHVSNKKFTCEKCSKVFKRNSSLKIHSSSHLGFGGYRCAKCPKYFNDRKSLLRHERIHTIKSKYRCNLCKTTSIRKDNIIRHLRNMHPNADKSYIQEIRQDYESSENQSSPDTESNGNDEPKTVANSSVIRCIGNVEPVTVVKDYQPVLPQSTDKMIRKKSKKPFDPHAIYRKILCDDDSTEDYESAQTEGCNERNIVTRQTSAIVEQTKHSATGQQSIFSETHWRKNFKHNYQIQFD